ncbi:MAG: methyltransferase domain-containing protein, partial [Anaerolineales bacterium]
FITCLETIEHVGNIEQTLDNILGMVAPGGHVLISVPIEIAFWGIIKFLAKVIVFRYDLDELVSDDWKLKAKYFLSLITYQDISKYRKPRGGYVTHFGFDYRQIDRILKERDVSWSRTNYFTTAYYLIAESTSSDPLF